MMYGPLEAGSRVDVAPAPPVQVLSTCNPITIKAYAEAFANATVNIAGQGCNPIYFTALSRESGATCAELPVAQVPTHCGAQLCECVLPREGACANGWL